MKFCLDVQFVGAEQVSQNSFDKRGGQLKEVKTTSFTQQCWEACKYSQSSDRTPLACRDIIENVRECTQLQM